MAIAFVKSAKGTSALATVPWAFGTATTSGNLIVGCFAGDDYNGSPTTGWTQSSEMEQQTFHGAYIWWRISTGETNLEAYTIGSATNSAWVVAEFSGVHATPYDVSEGQLSASAVQTYTTPTCTPTTGARLLVAMIGGSKSADLTGTSIDTWLNSFTSIDGTGSAGSGSNDMLGIAYRLVTGDSSTTFSTGGTYQPSGSFTPEARTGLIIAFKEAAGGGQSVMPLMMSNYQ